MLQSLVPVLLLGTVALSSTYKLPIESVNHLETEPSFDGQENDNIPSNNRLQSNILHNLFYKWSNNQNNRMQDYMNTDNNDLENFEDTIPKDDNYDGKGFRKEQWHNYPRQLDRLNLYKLGSDIPDYDDPGNDDLGIEPRNQQELLEIPKLNKVEGLMTQLAKPLYILKVRLGNIMNDTVSMKSNLPSRDPLSLAKSRDLSLLKFRSSLNNLQKRKNTGNAQKIFDESSTGEKTVKKRLFAAWSRLRSLTPTGHGLHHRRHIYALYNNLQDSNGGGGGILTAETRAFIRPPGSPLRWG